MWGSCDGYALITANGRRGAARAALRALARNNSEFIASYDKAELLDCWALTAARPTPEPGMAWSGARIMATLVAGARPSAGRTALA